MCYYDCTERNRRRIRVKIIFTLFVFLVGLSALIVGFLVYLEIKQEKSGLDAQVKSVWMYIAFAFTFITAGLKNWEYIFQLNEDNKDIKDDIKRSKQAPEASLIEKIEEKCEKMKENLKRNWRT